MQKPHYDLAFDRNRRSTRRRISTRLLDTLTHYRRKGSSVYKADSSSDFSSSPAAFVVPRPQTRVILIISSHRRTSQCIFVVFRDLPPPAMALLPDNGPGRPAFRRSSRG
jgi:hypothetical protein